MRLKLQSIADAIIATDADGRITLMNPAAEKMCGITMAEAEGKMHEEVFNILDGETGGRADSPVRKALATGKTVEPADRTDLIAVDGKRRHIADTLFAIPDPAAHHRRLLVSAMSPKNTTSGFTSRENMISDRGENGSFCRVHYTPAAVRASWMPLDESFRPERPRSAAKNGGTDDIAELRKCLNAA